MTEADDGLHPCELCGGVDAHDPDCMVVIFKGDPAYEDVGDA